LTKEQEKSKIKEEKSKMAKLKIWDKKTASTNRPLKRYKNNELPSIDISTDKQRYDIFNTKQRGLIDKALAIVKERSEVPQPKKENISTFLRQKKEMFLVEMSNNIVKEKIEKIQEKIEKDDKKSSDIDKAKELKKVVKQMAEDTSDALAVMNKMTNDN
jgi:hypothetical protein